MPSKAEVDFDELRLGSVLWLITERGSVYLVASDPENGIFAVEHPDGSSFLCFVAGSVMDGVLTIGKIIPGKHLWAISGEMDFTSPIITAVKYIGDGDGIAKNILARASKNSNI